MKATKQIVDKMKKEGRSVSWLSIKLGISNGYLNNMLKERQPLLDHYIVAINKVLNTNFTNANTKKSSNVT